MKQIWFVVATGSFDIGARRQVTQIECLSYMVIDSPRRRMILAISRKSTVQVWFDPRRFGGYWIVPQSLEATEGIDWISIYTIMNIFNSLFYSWILEELSETGLFTLSSHLLLRLSTVTLKHDCKRRSLEHLLNRHQMAATWLSHELAARHPRTNRL